MDPSTAIANENMSYRQMAASVLPLREIRKRTVSLQSRIYFETG